MDFNQKIKVSFSNVKWPVSSLPETFSKNIRALFLFNDVNGKCTRFSDKDTYDILKVYLTDEYDEVPDSFEYDIHVDEKDSQTICGS